MKKFTKGEFENAFIAITSLLGKCEKEEPKLKDGSSQKTLIKNRIKALQIASILITNKIK